MEDVSLISCVFLSGGKSKVVCTVHSSIRPWTYLLPSCVMSHHMESNGSGSKSVNWVLMVALPPGGQELKCYTRSRLLSSSDLCVWNILMNPTILCELAEFPGTLLTFFPWLTPTIRWNLLKVEIILWVQIQLLQAASIMMFNMRRSEEKSNSALTIN